MSLLSRIRRAVRSYRLRVAVGYVAVVTLLGAAWAWSLYGPLTSAVTDQQRSYLTEIARADAHALVGPGSGLHDRVELVTSDTPLRLTVVAGDGTVLADSQEDAALMSNHAGRPEVAAALAGRVGSDTRVSPTQGTPQMYVAVPGIVDGRRVAVRVSEQLATIDELAASARRSGLIALAAALVLAALLAWSLTRRTAGPVSRLATAALAMAEGDLTVPVPDEKGDLGAVSAALVSLRDRVRGTIAGLESARATLATVLDGMPDAVFLLDGECVDYANAAATRLFGDPASGWQGIRLGPPALPASLGAAIELVRMGGGAGSTAVGPDPLQRYFDVSAAPVDLYDGSSRTLVVVSDTTDVRRLDAVRRDFVANASHELKTPAAAISLLASSAAAAAADGDAAQALAFVSEIEPEAERLRRLVSDLLDLSRLESPPERGRVTDARQAVADAVAGHGAAARAAGLTLDVDAPGVEGQDVFVLAGVTDVAIALDNVLANAIAYTPRGGVTVRLDASDDAVSIAVADTGIGIPAEHLSRVFERFYRVDPARSRESGGTGLGLSLVRNAMERAGGRVEIASEPGVGTTVTLTLPRAR